MQTESAGLRPGILGPAVSTYGCPSGIGFYAVSILGQRTQYGLVCEVTFGAGFGGLRPNDTVWRVTTYTGLRSNPDGPSPYVRGHFSSSAAAIGIAAISRSLPPPTRADL